jgi:hypothetical protein
MTRKVPKARKREWLTASQATDEIKKALRICDEAASMTLHGLWATDNVAGLDDETRECTVGEGNPSYFSASDVRHWLIEWVPSPQVEQRDQVIAELLSAGSSPGRGEYWPQFCNEVRDRCDGWRSKRRAKWGFGDRQIQRSVKRIRGF